MIGYLTDERDWSAMLDKASTVGKLRAGVKGWAPFVADAQKIADAMDDADLKAFHTGLKKERKAKFAGEKWHARFGALLLPAGLMRGSMVAEQYKVPLGTALIQLQNAGAFAQPLEEHP